MKDELKTIALIALCFLLLALFFTAKTLLSGWLLGVTATALLVLMVLAWLAIFALYIKNY